jgi:hypothetical protein
MLRLPVVERSTQQIYLLVWAELGTILELRQRRL